jgi:hypothetical protein
MKAVAERDRWGEIRSSLFIQGQRNFLNTRRIRNSNAPWQAHLLHRKDVVAIFEVVLVSPLPVHDTVLTGWVVEVQRHDVDAARRGEAWEWSALTRGRVTDAEAAVQEADEEAVARSVYLEAGAGILGLQDWVCTGCAVECEEVAALEDWICTDFAVGLLKDSIYIGFAVGGHVDWRCTELESKEEERWLAPVVDEDEIRGGGEAAPLAADCAAAEDILDRKADKDLPH